MSQQALIADRRFQHYEGRRLGVSFSFWSLVLHSVLWALGLKRSARYKIVPIIVIAIAYLPSLILIVVATVAPPGTQLPGYADSGACSASPRRLNAASSGPIPASFRPRPRLSGE